jgi:hypothetical protein
MKKIPRTVVLALDNDDAGHEATESIKTTFGRDFYMVCFDYDEAKDPNGLDLLTVERYAKYVEAHVAEYEATTQRRNADWKATKCEE